MTREEAGVVNTRDCYPYTLPQFHHDIVRCWRRGQWVWFDLAEVEAFVGKPLAEMSLADLSDGTPRSRYPERYEDAMK